MLKNSCRSNPIPHKDQSASVTECKAQTMEHIEEVRKYIRWFTDRLTDRGVEHDKTKLQSPEIDQLIEAADHIAVLPSLEYGSEAYNREYGYLKAVHDHHYAKNRHHPEHFANGINDMDLIDIIEMFCDWCAASKRNKNGSIQRSIEVGATRFEISDQLKQIFLNTAEALNKTQ